jgi:hypothetical protein
VTALTGIELRRAIEVVRVARWITRERVMRWGVGFAAMSRVLLALHVISYPRTGLSNSKGNQLCGDFIRFWSSAKLAVSLCRDALESETGEGDGCHEW